MMKRVELLLLLLLVLLLSSQSLRVESEAGFFVGKRGGCRVDEKEALLNFKQNIFHHQLHISHWDIGEDCCTWKGVRCNNTTNHVIKLDLRWLFHYEVIYFNATSLTPSLFRLQKLQYLCLSGFHFNDMSIPQSIFLLGNLHYLDLSYSSCAGVILPQLENLTNLRHLDLSYTNFIKVIPSHIGNLINLRYISLSNVGLIGVIPTRLGNLTNLQHLDLHNSHLATSNLLWISSLSSLKYLDMSEVNLSMATNWLQDIKMLPVLSTLHLSSCNLQTLPNSLPYANFSSTLMILDLSANQFHNSTIPLWLFNMTNLVEHYMYDSQLFGKIPNNLLGDLCRLRRLDLSFNLLDGTISSMILGQLPQCTNGYELKRLDLSHNYLSGMFPNWLEQFRSLNILYLQSNNLTGPVLWSSLSLLCDLHILDLSKNGFTELIDEGRVSRCKEYKMTTMDISKNQLSGSIPESIGQMRHLKYVNLGKNQLNGSLPQSLGQLMNMKYLNLGVNLLQDSLSHKNFANLSQLDTLLLSNNHLDFKGIKFNWVPPFQLSTLLLRSCHIGPHFPIWLQTQKSLHSLDISNSGISDIIPSWFWNISSQVYYLNVSHNAIRGELPILLNTQAIAIDMGSNLLEGHLPQLMGIMYYVSFSDNKFSYGIESNLNSNLSTSILDFSDNYLSDEIPNSICQMNSMNFLDLSYNNLRGEIPKCKRNNFNSTNLLFINFENNDLWGSIPQWIGSLPRLRSLHLSNNNFQEDISFLRNCSKLVILDLGQNNFTGNIPLWIGDKLSNLKILRLRSNKFHGSIPSSLSNLKELQILDLANNFFSGQLLKSFKLFKSMTTLNKSLEHLVPIEEMYFEGEHSTTLDYSNLLKIYIKGAEREFTTTLSLMTSMDLSCNNLGGEVPIELMSLAGLISLNLSKNQFTGQIPINIGAMKSLENLDLSWNHISGKIPKSITNLSKLSYLNLSYNQLSGSIPIGTQLETFDNSSYYGNLNLCGKPLLKTCEDNEHNIHSGGSNSNDDDYNFDFFLSMSIGFVVGLWSVLGILMLKKSWAITYFRMYDDIMDIVYVFVIIRFNRWFN